MDWRDKDYQYPTPKKAPVLVSRASCEALCYMKNTMSELQLSGFNSRSGLERAPYNLNTFSKI